MNFENEKYFIVGALAGVFVGALVTFWILAPVTVATCFGLIK